MKTNKITETLRKEFNKESFDRFQNVVNYEYITVDGRIINLVKTMKHNGEKVILFRFKSNPPLHYMQKLEVFEAYQYDEFISELAERISQREDCFYKL